MPDEGSIKKDVNSKFHLRSELSTFQIYAIIFNKTNKSLGKLKIYFKL
jgi:hypothetical protein